MTAHLDRAFGPLLLAALSVAVVLIGRVLQ